MREAGYETFNALADAEVDDLAGLTGTLTESRAAVILQDVPQHVPVGSRLAVAAAQRYARRIDAETDRGIARVVDLTTTDVTVGEPIYRTEGLDPDVSEAQYVSAIGRNATEPVATGLHILDDPDHPDVPKAVTHPDAGDDALPVDESGQVVPPAVPVEPRLQLPNDELLAKKLARGLVPRTRPWGPFGRDKASETRPNRPATWW